MTSRRSLPLSLMALAVLIATEWGSTLPCIYRVNLSSTHGPYGDGWPLFHSFDRGAFVVDF
ncbi:hypothetical protein GCM10012278_36960 [Nonomuraea glycinis]|uniref:Uncharacterized protein n=1 Tax=Nonomuraea glycinis TaxID=2047744 RepID=A0A918A4Y3_9ACTN|nr:hypothetical protein GCM10012278_36960 [Nonomuraea glycinis]